MLTAGLMRRTDSVEIGPPANVCLVNARDHQFIIYSSQFGRDFKF
jgi:hypothetical protein